MLLNFLSETFETTTLKKGEKKRESLNVRKLLVVAVSPHTSNIIKNCLHVVERGENSLQNGILHYTF